jgi:isoquinoline 1-oxidoreductase beta subunit
MWTQCTPIPPTTRREFLQSGVVLGTGLVIGFHWSRRGARAAEQMAVGTFAPNAFVRIAPDDTVTVIAKHIEFGQGTHTGLATIVAEELDAAWSQIRVEAAPADATRYNNLFFGPVQGTGGSTAMANSWQQLRQAGAMGRAMLVAAAASLWETPDAGLTVSEGRVSDPSSGRSASFGELAETAAAMSPPDEVELKDPKDFKLIGTRLPRVDVPPKVNGQARFTFDVSRPGMLIALVARPPRFGATVKSVDDSAARKIDGVAEVVQIPTGVAVLGDSFWAAKKGRDALRVDWDESQAEMRSSSELLAEYRGLLDKPGPVARRDGDAEATLAGAAKVLAADYEFPYLAHAPMEPLDCVVQLDGDRCEVWAGSQLQTVDQGVVAATLGLPVESVRVHTLLAGGTFGRRATPGGDVASEAASIVKAIEGRAPVKLVRTREDDIQGGFYRPLYVHRLRAGLDAEGKLVAWHHRLVGQSILMGTPFESALVKDGIDSSSVEGAATLPYAIPNLGVELHTTAVGVPVLWWRSVGHTHTAFSTETFLDEIARAAGKDPVALRRELLRDHPRHLGVLELAVKKAGWDEPLPEGRARGIAVHESFSSFVAQVAEISLGSDGLPVVERVVCAVDCGIAINPDNIRAQMEGGIGFGLGAALHDEILLEEGRVVQSNFHDYRSLRIHEMPRVEVHIVPSGEPPTGVGEPGVPPIAPAVANAYLRLTGRPIHRLPFRHLSA